MRHYWSLAEYFIGGHALIYIVSIEKIFYRLTLITGSALNSKNLLRL